MPGEGHESATATAAALAQPFAFTGTMAAVATFTQFLTCRGAKLRPLFLALLCVMAGCAQVPIVDENSLAKASETSQVKVYGTKGPLSARQSKEVLGRLASQAPDAGALERHLAVEQVIAESPLFTGNQVHLLRDGAETFPAMFAAIRNARSTLDLEYYILEDVSWEGESLSDLLVAKSREGVHISIIYDGIGSYGTPGSFFDKLTAAGIEVVEFNPPNPLKRHHSLNARDHRKMLIADGSLVILGGVNLSYTYQSLPPLPGCEPSCVENSQVWHDVDVRIEGPVVPELRRLYREHWNEQASVPMQSDSGSPTPQAVGDEVVRIIGSAPSRLKTRYYATVISAIRNAESSIWLTNAYFVPTHQERQSLMAAARRGVDVRLLLPSRSDSGPALAVQRSFYGELMRAGVKIYERGDGILHSKTLVIDRVWSIVGSSNFDHRSVLFNDEVDAVILGKNTGEQLAADFQADLQHARAIDASEWKHRSLTTRLRQSFWRLLSPLL